VVDCCLQYWVLGFIKCGEFIDWPSGSLILKEDCVALSYLR
jgi:hypothetical protein